MFSEHLISKISGLIKAINKKGADCCFLKYDYGAVRDTLYQLTSADIECPWCGKWNKRHIKLRFF